MFYINKRQSDALGMKRGGEIGQNNFWNFRIMMFPDIPEIILQVWRLKAHMDDEFVDLSARRSSTFGQRGPMVMRGEIDPEPRQMNAAKVLIEYEEPKLSAVGVAHMDGKDFASQLERAIERSRQPPPPAALLPAPEHSADELKKPFVPRRRNLR
jgi:hypothetical protein